jgi:hypothetical protein
MSGLPEQGVKVENGGQKAFDLVLATDEVENQPYRMVLEITGPREPILIPVTLMGNR